MGGVRITHCVKLTHKCWANTIHLALIFLSGFFRKRNKTEIADRTVGKDIYTVYKNDIQALNVQCDDSEDLAIAFNGEKQKHASDRDNNPQLQNSRRENVYLLLKESSTCDVVTVMTKRKLKR